MTWILLKQILGMIIMAAAGFCLTKSHIVKAADSEVLTKVSVYIITPCIMCYSFQIEFDRAEVQKMIFALAASILLFTMYLILSFFMGHGKRALNNAERASIIYGNSSNMAIPLIQGTLGNPYVPFISIYSAVQLVLVWTIGVKMMGGKSNGWKKILTNPPLIGIFFGLVLFVLKIRLTGPIAVAVENLGNCIGPISMVIIGMLVGNLNFRDILKNGRIYGVVFMRLIVCPMISIGLLLILGKIWPIEDYQNILMAIVICNSGPAAALVVQQAQLYGYPDVEYVSAVNILGTACCLFTLPAIALFYRLIL